MKWLLLSTAIWLRTLGWDVDGHLAVGMTTMSGIKGTALTQLKRLLGGKDVVDTATWTHSVLREYPELERLFYQTQDKDIDASQVDCDKFDPYENCPEGQCLSVAAEYFYLEMVKKGGELGKNPSNDEGRPPVSHKHPGFRMSVDLILTDTDRMKFLTAVIAELHSPSKFGYKANNNGKNIVIEFPDSGDRLAKTTLFDYWDSNLIQKTKRDRPSFWYSGWTHYNSLGRVYYESEQEKWNSASLQERLKLLRSWGAETFKWSCEKTQRKSSLYQPDGSDSDDSNNNRNSTSETSLLIPNGYTKSAHEVFVDFEYVKNLLLLAGIRTSLVLNSILATREAKQLRLGSGVKVKLDLDGQSGNPWPSNNEPSLIKWTRNFGINICIIGAVMGVFALFVRYGSTSSPGMHNNGGKNDGLKAAANNNIQMKMKD